MRTIERVPIESLCLKVTSGGTPSRGNDRFWNGGGIPWYKTGDLNDSYLSEAEEFITEEAIRYSAAKVFPPNTVLMAMYGDGKTITTLGILREAAATNQACCAFIVDPAKCDFRYLFYALKTIRREMLQFVVAGAQRNLSTGIIRSFGLPIFPLDKQRRIAEILSAYDDLIENNRRRIKLLEEAARLIYREWFIHLRFPGREHTKIENGVPEGWDRRPVGDLLESHIGGGWGADDHDGDHTVPAFVIRGTDIPDLIQGDFGRIPYRYHKASNLATRELQSGDLILEVSNGNINNIGRSFRVDSYLLDRLGDKAICASFCKMLRPLSERESLLLACHLSNMQACGTMNHFKTPSAAGINNFRFPALIADESVLIPGEELLTEFCEIEGALYRQRSVIAVQIAKLKQAHDLLIPRLMSGEIEV